MLGVRREEDIDNLVRLQDVFLHLFDGDALTHCSLLLNVHTVLVGFHKRMVVPRSSRRSYAIQRPVEMQNFMISPFVVDDLSIEGEGS